MAKAIFRLEPDKARWQGPFRSKFGLHLVLVTRAQAARLPALGEVQDQLATELQRLREIERKQTAIDELIGRFEVRVSPEFESVPER
ncbi:MAG: hypothetical protein HON77_08455 [Gammaproteobacteria bacterium]|nr:hypothetical protein [Gammaproteobacteria bacterium]